MLLTETEDYKPYVAIGETYGCLTQSETLGMWRSSLTGTWEVSELPERSGRRWKVRTAITV